MRAIRESFLREIWGHAVPTNGWFQAIRESFLCEILTSYGSAKVFSLESLPLYGNHIKVFIPDCLYVDFLHPLKMHVFEVFSVIRTVDVVATCIHSEFP